MDRRELLKHAGASAFVATVPVLLTVKGVADSETAAVYSAVWDGAVSELKAQGLTTWPTSIHVEPMPFEAARKAPVAAHSGLVAGGQMLMLHRIQPEWRSRKDPSPESHIVEWRVRPGQISHYGAVDGTTYITVRSDTHQYCVVETPEQIDALLTWV